MQIGDTFSCPDFINDCRSRPDVREGTFWEHKREIEDGEIVIPKSQAKLRRGDGVRQLYDSLLTACAT